MSSGGCILHHCGDPAPDPAIVGGWISDNRGRLRSIAAGGTLGVFSYIGLILAPPAVVLARSVCNPSLCPGRSSYGAFVAEEFAEENRAGVYGITNVIYTLVAVISPNGWLVADTYSFRSYVGSSPGSAGCHAHSHPDVKKSSCQGRKGSPTPQIDRK